MKSSFQNSSVPVGVCLWMCTVRVCTACLGISFGGHTAHEKALCLFWFSCVRWVRVQRGQGGDASECVCV